MKFGAFLATLFLGGASAFPSVVRSAEENPFIGRKLYVNRAYAAKLEETFDHFIAANDTLNALKTRTVQETGSFVWISSISGLGELDRAISAARAEQRQGGVKQIVGLVLYDLPDRDCSAGESAGELTGRDGLRRYKDEYVNAWYDRLRQATDLTFAVAVEPDAIGNMVTNQHVPFCAEAQPIQEEGIAYAIKKLQLPNVNLYLDASHGGWLGWPDNLPLGMCWDFYELTTLTKLAAQQFAKILRLAGDKAKIRGFATNVSNYNPFKAVIREDYTEWSPSWDEDHYTQSLAVELEKEGLPTKFIVDQGRVHLPGARKEWGEWCNVNPAGLGSPERTETDNPHVDALVWIKPPGESDGRCGLAGAPAAGAWFNDYTVMLVENASEDIKPAASLDKPTRPWW
ncbi:1,4-beta-D-glucan cellobiohydrolase CEL6B [Paramyrothecium foliicola]|nr:1,4-beta-D-glucan cellobiohydrolase CEL6B [Paramyrothecium foliicola]